MRTKTTEVQEVMKITLDDELVQKLKGKEQKETLDDIAHHIKEAIAMYVAVGYYNSFSTEGWAIRMEEQPVKS